MSARQRLIFASGGHEFSRRRGNEALRDYILGLSPRPWPRVCLLPTASGDPAEQITAFQRAFGDRPCHPSHVSLFRLEAEPVAVGEHLLRQDILYVGGGSMLNLLAIWYAHGVDHALREAWERGVVLAGQSAGALCWFEQGISLSAGRPTVAPGLGLLPGALSVHYHRDRARREVLRRAVVDRRAAGYAVDDQAGLLFSGTELVEAVSATLGAGAWRVEPDGRGGSRETRLELRELSDPRPPIDEPSPEVRELRQLRAARTGGRFARR
jgi:dipeptidase E